jgi:hypothetical protein
MKDENTIKSIKIKIKENTFSSDLLRLLKSNKIDRFAKRYMEKKNDKININNNTNNKIVKIFSPKSIIRREEIKLVDEDKISNDDIFNQNLFFRVEKLKGFDDDNFSYGSSSNLEDNTKSNMINSASQTSNNNKCEEDKIKNEKKKLILSRFSGFFSRHIFTAFSFMGLDISNEACICACQYFVCHRYRLVVWFNDFRHFK